MRRVTHTVKSAKCHVDDQGDQGQGHVDDEWGRGIFCVQLIEVRYDCSFLIMAKLLTKNVSLFRFSFHLSVILQVNVWLSSYRV
jgi:hypothetical protein